MFLILKTCNMTNDIQVEFKQVELIDNTKIVDGVYSLRFRRFFDFIPGQVISIKLTEDMPGRLYSIASSNRSEYIDILFRVRHEGLLSPQLANLCAGDKLYVSTPMGNFTDQQTDSVWIAAGTGIAPYLSMIRSGVKGKKTLIFGASYRDHFYNDKELTNNNIVDKYVRCCSREEHNDCFYGRVTAYIDQIKDLPNRKYYLCGNPEMVVEVRDKLIKRGIAFNDILAEIYF